MNRIKRYVVFGIGVVLALYCGALAIVCFFCGVLEGEEGSWLVFFLFAVGCAIGVFLTCPLQFTNALRNSCIAEALHLGGRQMLCDIIKWTIIIIIAAIVFTIAYKIAISSGKTPGRRISPVSMWVGTLTTSVRSAIP